jgi:hypothetical protein
MLEGDPRSVDQGREVLLTRRQKVSAFASEISRNYNLDRVTYEALSKYAILRLRINEVVSDFRESEATSVRYSVYQEGETIIKKTVSRDEYPDFIKNSSMIAFNLYNAYLSNDSSSRAAAREIQVLVDDIYPKK